MDVLTLGFIALLIAGMLALASTEPKPSRQFSIRNFLAFILLWAIFFSQVSVLPLDDKHLDWGKDWVVLFAWTTLAIVYACKRLFASLLMHSVGVLFSGWIFIVPRVMGYISGRSEISNLLIGMFVGSFAGLVYFSIRRLLGLLARSEPSP
jgi:hypothetical protein